MQKTKLLLTIYAAAVATDLLAITNQIEDIRLISKSVLMPILAIYAFIRISRKKETSFLVLITALGFSWLGDILLLFDAGSDNYFIYGLGAFLIAHIGYIVVNRKATYPNTSTSLLSTQKMRYIFIIVLAGSAVVHVLYAHLGALKLPVIVYAAILTLMAISALYRFGRTSHRSFVLVFTGAVLFMLSDTLLAVDKFVETFPYAGFWIMATYSSAQFLIVEGVAVHDDEGQ
ncbi:lysoplasmalogenase [Fulvivirga sp. RKSG066]|uniref:lysoplasmalogenase n=1 Tax=Fulvivirga aurantia TaxID=2529383 RepID=UPI0012BBA178|nr:lysoplasmalogenase [Fulvivirga aurantia]MTI22192.1 lysoplasmalogenase [Fulvivirga aurantia]